jgi:hypothetical protein
MPTLAAAGYDKQAVFVNWTAAAGYRTVMLQDPWFHPATEWTPFKLFDLNRDDAENDEELNHFDREVLGEPGYGWLSDDERDEDADGLSNYDELHGRMQPACWNSCYADEPPSHVAYQGTSAVDADTDGDGVLDGADDQDHDDVPNVMELSRIMASGETGHAVLRSSPGERIASRDIRRRADAGGRSGRRTARPLRRGQPAGRGPDDRQPAARRCDGRPGPAPAAARGRPGH